MSTADLIAAAPILGTAPDWRKDEAISIQCQGDAVVTTIAADLDRHAADRGFAVGEVARVSRQGVEVIYARSASPSASAPAPSPSAALLKSQEFGGFLDKAITDTKSQAMNKFAELAAKIRAGQAEMDQEAEALSTEVDATLEAFRDAAGQHRSMLGAARDGVKAMQEAASGLIGHNGAPK